MKCHNELSKLILNLPNTTTRIKSTFKITSMNYEIRVKNLPSINSSAPNCSAKFHSKMMEKKGNKAH